MFNVFMMYVLDDVAFVLNVIKTIIKAISKNFSGLSVTMSLFVFKVHGPMFQNLVFCFI